MGNQPRIGDLLLEAGAITREQLNEALRHQKTTGGRLGTNLVELGFIDEKRLASVLSRQLTIPSATAAQIDRASPEALRQLPPMVAERLRAVPIREDQGRLWIAMADPTDRDAVDELTRITGRAVRPMIAPELLMQYALEKHYQIKRRPRFVEVRTAGAELLVIEGVEHVVQARREEVPVYDPMPAAVNNLDSLSGFLDEAAGGEISAGGQAASRMPMKEIIDALLAATSDEAIFDLAMRYVAQDAPRLGVLLLRGAVLAGWRGKGVDPHAFSAVKLQVAELPVVTQVLANGECYVGRLAPLALGRLAGVLGVQSEVLGLVMPVRIGKRAVGCVIGVDCSLEAMRRKAEMDQVALKLDQALHISYLRRQILAT